MIAPAETRAQTSPLGALPAAERAAVITALSQQLAPDDAVAALTALAGSYDEVVGLPWDLQRRIKALLLDALPRGTNAIVVSLLGIAALPSESWLPEVRAKINAMRVPEAVAAIAKGRIEPLQEHRAAQPDRDPLP